VTAVQPDTASALADAIFLFGRTLRAALIHNDADLVPNALAGVLFVLARLGECRPSELACEMHVSQSSLSRSIGELVGRGLVEKHPDPDDRRAHRISCSAAGFEALEQIGRRRTERLTERLGDWEEGDVTRALDVIDRLTATLAPIAADDVKRTCS